GKNCGCSRAKYRDPSSAAGSRPNGSCDWRTGESAVLSGITGGHTESAASLDEIGRQHKAWAGKYKLQQLKNRHDHRFAEYSAGNESFAEFTHADRSGCAADTVFAGGCSGYSQPAIDDGWCGAESSVGAKRENHIFRE